MHLQISLAASHHAVTRSVKFKVNARPHGAQPGFESCVTAQKWHDWLKRLIAVSGTVDVKMCVDCTISHTPQIPALIAMPQPRRLSVVL
jgi:hypothetical protein